MARGNGDRREGEEDDQSLRLRAEAPLGSLAMSQVEPASTTLAYRAVTWQDTLDRLGIEVPFALVHDVGLLFASPPGQRKLGPRCDLGSLLGGRPTARDLLEQYRSFIAELAECEAARRAPGLALPDALVAALVARVLSPLAKYRTVKRPYVVKFPQDTTIFELPERSLGALWARRERSFELDALAAVARARLGLLTIADTLDPDALELFGVLGAGDLGDPLQLTHLLAALGDLGVRDIVSFSLAIVPSVLETKAKPAASTVAAFGYAGVGRRGSIDGLVLSELAWDSDELTRRILDDEVLYYTRDQTQEDEGRIHHLLIDASASMRGERTTFARGLALATAKKLILAGEEVVFRFFDSRLYDPITVRRRGRGGASAKALPTAQVLSFRGERGRNSVRVISSLVRELVLFRKRDGRRPVVHLFTHAANDVPRPLIAALTEEASLSAVFLAPEGGELHLDYLDLLDAHWVVTNEVLTEQGARDAEAQRILGTAFGGETTGADLAARRALAGSPGSPGSAWRGRGVSGEPHD
jgi:hypothetical protein